MLDFTLCKFILLNKKHCMFVLVFETFIRTKVNYYSPLKLFDRTSN